MNCLTASQMNVKYTPPFLSLMLSLLPHSCKTAEGQLLGVVGKGFAIPSLIAQRLVGSEQKSQK